MTITPVITQYKLILRINLCKIIPILEMKKRNLRLSDLQKISGKSRLEPDTKAAAFPNALCCLLKGILFKGYCQDVSTHHWAQRSLQSQIPDRYIREMWVKWQHCYHKKADVYQPNEHPFLEYCWLWNPIFKFWGSRWVKR